MLEEVLDVCDKSFVPSAITRDEANKNLIGINQTYELNFLELLVLLIEGLGSLHRYLNRF
jgi:hypothetical protein